MKFSSMRLAMAAWIAPAGTVVVPPVHRTPLPRPDIARTPPSIPGMVRVQIPRADRQPTGMLMIKQCRDSSMWYARHVGEFVPVLGHMEGDWKVRDTSGFINVVRHDDGIFIRESR